MVSPSKKRKLEGKSVANASGTTLRATSLTGDCRLQRTRKPLADKRFFIDLKNHVSSSKLERRLKSLGASVDAFLTREVTYVQKSRAEAMLEKARQQQQTHLNTIDPLENAVCWGIPIWPLNKVLKWLDKIESNLNSASSYLSLKTKSLRSPFVKFEDLTKQYRPVYGSIAVWPTLNLDCGEGGCPFSVPKSPIGHDKKPLRNAPQPVFDPPQCDQSWVSGWVGRWEGA
ncbi:hypothetical protein B566_EDAN014414 [Ephemera danica]|nr:hypothetical protein B566_EDAN014414 [Ephemera danica]